jgi:hypothetical protein
VEYLDGGGPVLGILPIANYSEYRAKLAPGDVLAIYSDGVTEANNANEEEFGDERFAEVLKANRHKSAAEIVAAVNQALTDFAAGSPPADDITLDRGAAAVCGVPAVAAIAAGAPARLVSANPGLVVNVPTLAVTV